MRISKADIPREGHGRDEQRTCITKAAKCKIHCESFLSVCSICCTVSVKSSSLRVWCTEISNLGQSRYGHYRARKKEEGILPVTQPLMYCTGCKYQALANTSAFLESFQKPCCTQRSRHSEYCDHSSSTCLVDTNLINSEL